MELRSRLGFATTHENHVDLCLEQCLLPKERQRLAAFHEKARRLDGNVCIADLGQNVGWTSIGPRLPVLTRNMLLCDVRRDRLITAGEMCLSQGHPVMAQGPGSHVVGLDDSDGSFAWRGAFQELSRRQKIALVGNGQHLASTGAFVLWVLSNLVHVDDLDMGFQFMGEHRLALGSGRIITIDDDSD